MLNLFFLLFLLQDEQWLQFLQEPQQLPLCLKIYLTASIKAITINIIII